MLTGSWTLVYATLADRAAVILRGSHSAIVDAVYARSADREAIERVAGAASVPFVGVWIDAPESTLMARAAQRRNDASDADAQVVRRQLAEGAGTIDWHHLDGSTGAEEVLRSAIAFLRLGRPVAL